MIRKHWIWLICLLLVLATGSDLWAAGNPVYERALAGFIREIDVSYPFFELKNIRRDWDLCKRKLLRDVQSCRSNEAFYRLLDEARRCLRDSHIQFSNLKGEYPQGEKKYYPGISFLPAVKKQVVIMASVPEYGGDLGPGIVVTKIDGQAARKYLEASARKQWRAGGSFSSPQRARLFAYRIPLQGKENESHRIEITRDGKEKEIQVVSKWEARGWPHTYAMPTGLKQHGNCLYGKLDSGYGYIYLRRIRGDIGEALDAALSRFAGIRGLIVDLRGNGGGGYSAELFTRFNKKQGPTNGFWYYGGDMTVLIDAGTISAGETFARDLVNIAQAYLMGSRTAGSSSAKRTWQLPHDLGTVTLPTRSRWGFKGQPIEFKGISPHKIVEVEPLELQKGINSGIKRAEEYLEKQWARKSEAERKQPLIFSKEGKPIK